MSQNFLPKDVRDKLADLVIDGHKTSREVAQENSVHRNTVQAWVATRRAERGLPPVGTGATTREGALKKLQKVRQQLKERDDEVATLTRLRADDQAKIENLRATLGRARDDNTHLRATLRIFMAEAPADAA